MKNSAIKDIKTFAIACAVSAAIFFPAAMAYQNANNSDDCLVNKKGHLNSRIFQPHTENVSKMFSIAGRKAMKYQLICVKIEIEQLLDAGNVKEADKQTQRLIMMEFLTKS
jgi:hypothetical protein